MSKYTVEAQRGYPGPREYETGTHITIVGVYVESLLPKTNLEPYRLRRIDDPVLGRGYVLDGAIDLNPSLVWVTPSVKDPAVIIRLLAKAFALNPNAPSLKPEDFDRLAITHGYLRSQYGLKVLLPNGDREWVCRIMPPVAQNLRDKLL